DMLLSRTGYTGEDGFEVYAPVEKGLELFMELSKECMPCGLGSLDGKSVTVAEREHPVNRLKICSYTTVILHNHGMINGIID
ncbi:MAG: hypothetical protein QXH44_10085, partial [Pyrobaculum sp.]